MSSKLKRSTRPRNNLGKFHAKKKHSKQFLQKRKNLFKTFTEETQPTIEISTQSVITIYSSPSSPSSAEEFLQRLYDHEEPWELPTSPDSDEATILVPSSTPSPHDSNISTPTESATPKPTESATQPLQPKKRSTAKSLTAKAIVEHFFSQSPHSNSDWICKICLNQLASGASDPSRSNLQKHVKSPKVHLFKIDNLKLSDHWEHILKESPNRTKKQTLAAVDRVVEKAAQMRTIKTKQTSILSTVRRAERSYESSIAAGNLFLTPLEFQCFVLLGNILRNQSFASLEDDFEKVFRAVIYFEREDVAIFGQNNRSFQPVPSTVSRTTYSTKYLPILEAAALAEIKRSLATVTYCSTLTDGWSSRPGNCVHRFTGLCLAFVDWANHSISTQLLHFEPLNSAHTSVNLSQDYLSSINKVLPQNVMIGNQTTDNAPNELLAAQYVLQQKGFWKAAEACLAHTIQLDIEDFLEQYDIIRVLHPILKINSRLINNPTMKSAFIADQMMLGRHLLNPCSMVKTRWWSMLPGINFYINTRESLVNFITREEPNFFQKLRWKKENIDFTPPSFDDARNLFAYLNILKSLSDKLSSESKVTSCRVIFSIEQILQTSCNFSKPAFRRLTQLLSRVTVWSKAAFFHPQGLECLKRISGTAGEFNLYQQTREAILHDLTSLTGRSDDTNISGLFQPCLFRRSTMDGIEKLVSEAQPDPKLNIILFFSHQILPKLIPIIPAEGNLLKDYLSLLFSIPATQVACERVFSSASRAFDPQRSSMTSSTLTALVTIQRVFPNTNEGVFRALNAIRNYVNSHPEHDSDSDSLEITSGEE